jgi:hypothetical protein
MLIGNMASTFQENIAQIGEVIVIMILRKMRLPALQIKDLRRKPPRQLSNMG